MGALEYYYYYYFIHVRESVNFDEQNLEFYATLILNTILFRHGFSYPDS
jgi:hypothetical protein